MALFVLVAAFAVSLVVLTVGGVRADAGIALFTVGAAAALGLFALLARPSLLRASDGIRAPETRRRRGSSA
jgi:hypothetical protein